MKYDKPLLAGLIGAVSMIPAELYTQIFKYFGLTKISALEFTSMLMVTKPNWWVGLMSGFGVAGLAGIMIYYSTKVIGTDYLPVKAAGIAAVNYGFIDVFMGVLAKNPEVLQGTAGHYIHASSALLGGALAGVYIKRYLLRPDRTGLMKKIRRFSMMPEPSLKKEHFKKARFVKPKKP